MAEPDRPIAELLRDFSEQTSRLIRSEMELARAELTEKGTRAGLGIGMFGGAGAFGFWAFGALTAAVILLLATAVKPWLAAVIVCAALALIAVVLALTGRVKLKQAVPPVPNQATESVKEDVQWTKSRASQARR
jgi:Putative Actinobacterial Holin-X, holin superfamily III